MYSFLINSLPYPSFIADIEGNKLFYNSKYEKMIEKDAPFININSVRELFTELNSRYPLEKVFSGLCSIILPKSYWQQGRITITPIESFEGGYHALFSFQIDDSGLAGTQDSFNEGYDFLVSMNHELKTPLNSIMGITDMILRYNCDNLNEKQLKGLKIVLKNAKVLLSIVNDILDYSKIGVGQLDVNLIDIPLKKFVNNIKDIITPLVEQDMVDLVINIEPDVPEKIVSDYIKLQQILLNLFSNSVSFTGRGEIRLYVYVEDDSLYFQVSDTGSGIPDGEIENIFKAFYQVKGESRRKYKGSGLGLNITAKLLSLLDGDIKIESVYGEGTVATFSIPLIREPVLGPN